VCCVSDPVIDRTLFDASTASQTVANATISANTAAAGGDGSAGAMLLLVHATIRANQVGSRPRAGQCGYQHPG